MANNESGSSNTNRNIILIVVGVLLVFCLMCCGFTVLVGALSEEDNEDKQDQNQSQETEENVEERTEEIEANSDQSEEEDNGKSIEYEIIKEATTRYDNAKSYYVLASSLDITSDTIQEDVKIIVDSITAEKGKDISIEIFKTEEALNMSYDREVNLKLQSNQDIEYLSTNYIASYNGNFIGMLYDYSITFFPQAFRDNQTIGDKVDTIEYKP